jgi:hypothetical protein
MVAKKIDYELRTNRRVAAGRGISPYPDQTCPCAARRPAYWPTPRGAGWATRAVDCDGSSHRLHELGSVGHLRSIAPFISTPNLPFRLYLALHHADTISVFLRPVTDLRPLLTH